MKAVSEVLLSLRIARTATEYPELDVLEVVSMAITVFWGIRPYVSERVSHFVGTYRLHLVVKYCWFHPWFILQP
jgi:hypothetical protein